MHFMQDRALQNTRRLFEALVMVLEGACTLTIGGTSVRATPGTVVRMPADVPHALEAIETTRLLLVMLREPKRVSDKP